MAAKLISVSSDDVTYFTLPGSQGEISREGAVIDDTIFGQSYRSSMTGIIGWQMNANAIYKGFPGYLTTLKKPGASTAFNDEASTLVSGKTYQIDDLTKRVWNRNGGAFVVKDNAVDHTADVESIDYLFGKVTFKSAYVVAGPVTISGFYYPTIDLGKAMSYSLTMTANAIRDTNFPGAAANGGYNTHRPGLREVALELPAVFDAADAWPAALDSRGEYIIEINPDALGNNGSLCRGFFRLMSQRQAGNVGELEEETINFRLNVPVSSTAIGIDVPFSWQHHANSPIPAAIKTLMDAWLGETKPFMKYLPDGAIGVKGTGVVTSLSLSGGMETANTFAVSIVGDGALAATP